MISQSYLSADTQLQAEVLSRILLMRGCRFDQKSILQRLLIDTGIDLDPADLDELETRLGLRGPAWIKMRHRLEAALKIPGERLQFLDKLLPEAPAEAGIRFGELLWELGHKDVPLAISKAWPAFRLIINSAARVALLVKAGAPETRMDVVRLAGVSQSRLKGSKLTPLQVADLMMPHDKSAPDASELLVRLRGKGTKWKIPRGTRVSTERQNV
jgi:hypothetical protein